MGWVLLLLLLGPSSAAPGGGGCGPLLLFMVVVRIYRLTFGGGQNMPSDIRCWGPEYTV